MVPEPHVLSWLFATWLWLSRELPVAVAGALVVPPRLLVPVPPVRGHGRARAYFVRVCAAVEIDRARLALVPEDSGDTVPPGRAPVVYASWALDDPQLLVSQLATGVGHALVSRCDARPEDAETLDMTAELCAVYAGFGVFLANAASQLAAVRAEGALGPLGTALDERELSYALALFAWMNEVPDDAVSRHLAPNPRAFYAIATRDLRRRGRELGLLRAPAEGPQQGPYR